MMPADSSSAKRQASLVPIGRPRKRPLSRGPAETTIVGRSALAAPMSRAGVVLSQPTRSTTPSSGLPRIDSSTSMAARFRNSMALGRSVSSPRDMAGNSSGTPPASQTPRFTWSASSRSEALQGLRSDQLLQMPMIGLPWNSWSGRPSWRCTARCMKPVLSRPSNQVLDRNRLSVCHACLPGLPRAGE